VFITREAEEIIGDASVGGGEVNLIRRTHTGILSDGVCGSHMSEIPNGIEFRLILLNCHDRLP
jgi:hypothetical protein